MQWAAVIATAFISACATAVMGNTLGRRVMQKMEEGERKRDEARKEQTQSEVRRREEHAEIIDRLDALEDADRSLLRAELIRLHKRGVSAGCATLEEQEYMERTYRSYHRLGGNGIGTRLHDEFMSLPTKGENE
jgi:hypothetical protein